MEGGVLVRVFRLFFCLIERLYHTMGHVKNYSLEIN